MEEPAARSPARRLQLEELAARSPTSTVPTAEARHARGRLAANGIGTRDDGIDETTDPRSEMEPPATRAPTVTSAALSAVARPFHDPADELYDAFVRIRNPIIVHNDHIDFSVHHDDGIDDSNKAPAFAAVIGLLAFGSCVVIGLLAEFDHTVGGWTAAATVSYGLLLLLTTSFLGFGVMASVAGTRTMLWVSDLCARLGAILCSALLIVAISCKMGKPWGCAAGVPFAAVVACAMGAIGISWGRARALWTRVVVGRRRQSHQQPTGGDGNV